MKAGKKEKGILMAVLAPHGESRAAARSLSASLFAAGMEGAWAFPWVIPLAVLERRLEAEELRDLARRLRQRAGKICSLGPGFLPFPENVFSGNFGLYGLVTGLSTAGLFPEVPESGARHVFPQAVLGCAAAGDRGFAGEIPPGPGKTPGECAGSLSFRAAAVANMSYRPLSGELSFEWELGRLFWLPRQRRKERPA